MQIYHYITKSQCGLILYCSSAFGILVILWPIKLNEENDMARRDQAESTDTTSIALKTAKALTYIVYAYALTAVTFLSIGSILLLFGANRDTGFTQFIYSVGIHFLAPFRGIFPGIQIGNSGYFSTSAVFAIIMYLFFAILIKSLISYVTLKMVEHESQLEKYK
jgi:hypothetical protein